MKYLCKNKYWKINEDYDIDKLLYLMIDRPDKITECGDFIWRNNKKQYHRDYDLPSWFDNYNKNFFCLYWDKNGKQHREKSKPAFIDGYDGHIAYYINDKLIKNE